MNADDLKKLLDDIEKTYEDCGDILVAHNPAEVYDNLEKPQRRSLFTLVDGVFGVTKTYQLGFIQDDEMLSFLILLALASFDIGKDAGR